MKKYDLNIVNASREILEKAKELGWDGVGIIKKENETGNEEFQIENQIEKKQKEIEKLNIYNGVEVINGEPKKFLDNIIFCRLNRNLSKSNEVDVFTLNFNTRENRLDYITAKNMAENCIALEFKFIDLLNSTWATRAKIINIMRQNFIIAKKYDVLCIITSGASTPFELRCPKALTSIGKILGMDDKESKNAITKNPEKIINKVKNRNDDTVIMSGLKIIKFGKIRKEKKKSGYY